MEGPWGLRASFHYSTLISLIRLLNGGNTSGGLFSHSGSRELIQAREYKGKK